jgi:hypothetical protein
MELFVEYQEITDNAIQMAYGDQAGTSDQPIGAEIGAMPDQSSRSSIRHQTSGTSMKTLPGYQESNQGRQAQRPLDSPANASKEHHSDVCVAVSIEHKGTFD